MARHRPETLSADEAFGLLFPTLPTPGARDRNSPRLPSDWPRGIRPRGKAAIADLDKIIEGVIAEKKPARIKCPYFETRSWIHHSVNWAIIAREREVAIRSEHANRKKRLALARRIKTAAKLLHDVLENEDPRLADENNVIPHTGRGASKPDDAADDAIRDTFWRLLDDIKPAATVSRAMAQMATLMEEAEAKRLPLLDSKVSPWLTGFIEALGYWWVALSGEEPATTASDSAPFLKFAAAAYAALGGHSTDITQPMVRTVVARVKGGYNHKKRPDDQFDRYENEQTERETTSPSIAAWENRRRVFLEGVFENARSGDAFAQSIADAAYSGAMPHEKAFLDNLGYRPPKSS